MAYQKHPACKLPDNINQKIWRYTDFTKFISMLEEKAMFFPNILLFSDPLEGYLSMPIVKKFLTPEDHMPQEERQKRIDTGQHNLQGMKMARQLFCVSSWHMSEYESAAMWELYLKSGEGIAIQSTIGKMIKAFQNTKEDVHIGEVKYIDHEKDEMPWKNAFYLILHKRKSFEHEKELRAIVFDSQYPEGKLIPVTLDELIEKIYVAPNSPQWLLDLVQKVCTRYGLNKEIVHSGLNQKPLY